MRQKPGTKRSHGEKVAKDIRRVTRKQYSAEEKIRIILDGLKGEDSIAELCRREGIAQSLYYGWSKEFLEDKIVRFELGDDLLQPRILYFKALHLRQLRPAHPAKPPPPVVIRRIVSREIGPLDPFLFRYTPDAPTRLCNIITNRQLQLNLTQQPQDVFVRTSLPRHAQFLFQANVMDQF